MKLRLENNSIRYRLGKTELLQLKHNYCVQEIVNFPTAAFGFQLRVGEQEDLSAILLDNTIIVHIPPTIAKTFTDTDEVGIYGSVSLKGDETLDIIIEKDFPCKDRPEEDSSDKFSELAENEGKTYVC